MSWGDGAAAKEAGRDEGQQAEPQRGIDIPNSQRDQGTGTEQGIPDGFFAVSPGGGQGERAGAGKEDLGQGCHGMRCIRGSFGRVCTYFTFFS